MLLLLIHSGLKAQLSGTYTIDPSKKDSGTNYTSVSEAGLDLTTGYRTSSSATKNGPGVSGPVIFKIANGNFSTYVNFTKIKGSSSTNIITFE